MVSRRCLKGEEHTYPFRSQMAKFERLETVRKSLGRACNADLRATETVLFGPFWPSYTDQIQGWSVARTPFRAVSLSTTLTRTLRAVAYVSAHGEYLVPILAVAK